MCKFKCFSGPEMVQRLSAFLEIDWMEAEEIVDTMTVDAITGKPFKSDDMRYVMELGRDFFFVSETNVDAATRRGATKVDCRMSHRRFGQYLRRLQEKDPSIRKTMSESLTPRVFRHKRRGSRKAIWRKLVGAPVLACFVQ